MTLAELRAWLEEHKADPDVIAYLAGLSKVTVEGVTTFLATEEGKRLLQPITDRAVTQGIETFKTNNLDRLVKEEHDKRFPPEDDRDKRLRDIETELAQTKLEAQREKMLAKAIKAATEKGLPVSIIDRFVGDDDAATDTHIAALEASFKAAVEAEVDKRFKAGGRQRPDEKKPDDEGDKNPWKKDSLNFTEQGRITREDPEKAKRLKAEAGVK
jgi:hypothetical protein